MEFGLPEGTNENKEVYNAVTLYICGIIYP
jgi:hypothetical protein